MEWKIAKSAYFLKKVYDNENLRDSFYKAWEKEFDGANVNRTTLDTLFEKEELKEEFESWREGNGFDERVLQEQIDLIFKDMGVQIDAEKIVNRLIQNTKKELADEEFQRIILEDLSQLKDFSIENRKEIQDVREEIDDLPTSDHLDIVSPQKVIQSYRKV